MNAKLSFLEEKEFGDPISMDSFRGNKTIIDNTVSTVSRTSKREPKLIDCFVVALS